MQSYTPMMKQYLEVKQSCPDALLMFRLGDFYELFFEDAEIAAKELEITLTGRDAGGGQRAPMCGVPYHAAESYIATLVERGYKVAICEQMEDPSQAKGLVRREIVRIVTPGTLLEGRSVEDKGQRLVGAALPLAGGGWSVAFADVSTGDRWAGTVSRTEELVDDCLRYRPAELLLRERDAREPWVDRLKRATGVAVTALPDQPEKQPAESPLSGGESTCAPGPEDRETPALAALMHYVHDTQRRHLIHWKPVQPLHDGRYMIIDGFARRNLELFETIREGRKQGSLLWLLDETATAAGGRLLRRWLDRPLVDLEAIRRRQDAVEELLDDWLRRSQIREELSRVYDLERLLGRVSYGSAGAKDLKAIGQSLDAVPVLVASLEGVRSAELVRIREQLDPCTDLRDLLQRALVDDPPALVKEGGIIRDGFSPELDRLRRAAREGKEWIAALEQKERARTGIKSLKVGFNRVFGYYIEVTKANLSQVPPDYERRQTLASGERYVTPALKEMESQILNAEERAEALEYELFVRIRQAVADELPRLQRVAGALAELDVFAALAEVAGKRRFSRPVVDDGLVIDIRGGRHPVVEAVLPEGTFVPNDAYLDGGDHRISLITGPNMAGKSTYMRQVALIVLLAQMGSFVPAERARIGLVDRVFTRIGAADDLASGQSTFMVEMVELANILRHATPRSLIILDEIGRGTSTYDGMSIAQAVIEYLHAPDRIGARTLFATHYHELTQLADSLRGVRNYSTEVREQDGGIVFLHRVVDRPADRSYGIHVARLAGLPEELLRRAEEILATFRDRPGAIEVAAGEDPGSSRGGGPPGRRKDGGTGVQQGLHPVVDRLRRLRVLEMTPLQALQELYELHRMCQEEEEP